MSQAKEAVPEHHDAPPEEGGHKGQPFSLDLGVAGAGVGTIVLGVFAAYVAAEGGQWVPNDLTRIPSGPGPVDCDRVETKYVYWNNGL